MARSYILGGVAATGLATGVPYIRRITRLNGTATVARADGLTCRIVGGAIRFDGANGQSVDWSADTGGAGLGGELLFVEFPSTAQTITVELEEAFSEGAGTEVRLKACLTAEGQIVQDLNEFGTTSKTVRNDATNPASTRTVTGATDTMNPLTNGNFIEITAGSAATINARTKGIFIYIQKFAADATDAGGAGTNFSGVAANAKTLRGGTAGLNGDACNILVTAVLDHEGLSGSNGVATARFDAAGVEDSLRKIWPMSTNGSDGIG